MEIVGTSSTDQQIMDRSDEVSLDINEIATSLRNELNTKKVFNQGCCIYRVPARLRRLNEEAYTPSVVSIGPIHHETTDLSREDFATMILLDAVFVIRVLLLFSSANREYHECGSGDQIFLRPFKIVDVVWDMCLLENQLPFFFVKKVFDLYPIKNCTIMELTFDLLKKVWTNWVKEDSRERINCSGVLHFVDLLRKCQQPTEQHPPAENPTLSGAPTATELHQSGVKFKNPERNSLFDITFRNGILEIPQLTIDDHTEILFRNLQAFEQCHHISEDMFVSNYITFISCLVRAPNDVEVLVRNENLKNMLNSDEAVSNLLYSLDKENVVYENRFLWGVCKDLNSHCRKRRHKWMATLKQVYFNNPWTGISVAAATFLLILTVIQTVCSIIQL